MKHKVIKKFIEIFVCLIVFFFMLLTVLFGVDFSVYREFLKYVLIILLIASPLCLIGIFAEMHKMNNKNKGD